MYTISFRNFSIRQRLYVLFITFVITISSICIYFISIAFEKELYVVNNKNLSIINKINPILQDSISTLSSITKYPVLQTPNRTIMYNYLLDIKNNPSKYSQSLYQYNIYSNIQAECNQFFYLYPNITQVTLFDINGEGVLYRSPLTNNFNFSSTYKPITASSSDSWFQHVLSLKGSPFFLPQEILPDSSLFSNKETSLYASRAIINPDTLLPIGVILVTCDLSSILHLYNEFKQFENQKLGIYTIDKNIILETSPLDLSTQINTLSLNHKIYDYSYAIDHYLVIIETPFAPILINVLKKYLFLFVFLLFISIILIYILKLFVDSITSPINALIEGCHSIKQGNFQTFIMDIHKDEISELVKSFNSMSKQINTLIYEGYEKDLLHNQIELQMLRHQINPHFLYNTLESIRSAAYLKGEDDISNMALLLGNTLRYGVSNPQELVTLRTELNYLQDYISLQKIRYKDSLDFAINIEEHTMDAPIIKLILQPIVENAIYHGISSTSAKGHIHIMGYQDNTLLILKVIDNGIGITPSTLYALNDYISHGNDNFTSIGLKNVHRRINLYYGKDYGLHIDSILHQGTMVTLTLPFHTLVNND